MRSAHFTSAIALAIGLFVSNVSATIDLGDSLGTNCKTPPKTLHIHPTAPDICADMWIDGDDSCTAHVNPGCGSPVTLNNGQTCKSFALFCLRSHESCGY
jgi:hypothetical protein